MIKQYQQWVIHVELEDGSRRKYPQVVRYTTERGRRRSINNMMVTAMSRYPEYLKIDAVQAMPAPGRLQ